MFNKLTSPAARKLGRRVAPSKTLGLGWTNAKWGGPLGGPPGPRPTPTSACCWYLSDARGSGSRGSAPPAGRRFSFRWMGCKPMRYTHGDARCSEDSPWTPASSGKACGSRSSVFFPSRPNSPEDRRLVRSPDRSGMVCAGCSSKSTRE